MRVQDVALADHLIKMEYKESTKSKLYAHDERLVGGDEVVKHSEPALCKHWNSDIKYFSL